MRGAKPRNWAFSVCPRQFHEILALFESEAARKYTNPKTQAEEWMMDCFHLSLEAVKDAKRGRGPYARGKKCKVLGCPGGEGCLLSAEKEKILSLFRKSPC